MNKIPKILIQYGKLIDPLYIFYCQNNPSLKKRGWNDWIPPKPKELKRRILAYKKEWKKYEKKVLTEISGSLELSFNREVIDVFIVSGISRATSHPLIIKSGFKPKEFVITLVHELIHQIFDGKDLKFSKVLLIKDKDKTVSNHILVYALLRKIFKNKPEMLKIISDIKYNKDYKKAYEISKPYEDILKFFRKNK